jgi:hypothetical protein
VADALTAIRADDTCDKLFDKFGMTKLKTTTFAIRGGTVATASDTSPAMCSRRYGSSEYSRRSQDKGCGEAR